MGQDLGEFLETEIKGDVEGGTLLRDVRFISWMGKIIDNL
jgi:hypothetical protein